VKIEILSLWWTLRPQPRPV